VLITGISGFVGSHLADHLVEMGLDVYGLSRGQGDLRNIEHLGTRIRFLECQITDASSVLEVMRSIKPDYVFHLAAITSPAEMTGSPIEAFVTNVFGTINVLEAVRTLSRRCLVLLAGSSAEYGMVRREDNPIKENTPLRPVSLYGISKAAQGMVGYQYHVKYGLHIVRTRASNLLGPRERQDFVCSGLAKQIAEVEAGQMPAVVRVGNLEPQRDFTDVRDVVKAYWLALEKGQPGEIYNLCSEKSHSVREILEILLRLSPVQMDVIQDPSRCRVADIPLQIGDCGKFRALTGWRPEIPFEQSLVDLLDYWRAMLDSDRVFYEELQG